MVSLPIASRHCALTGILNIVMLPDSDVWPGARGFIRASTCAAHHQLSHATERSPGYAGTPQWEPLHAYDDPKDMNSARKDLAEHITLQLQAMGVTMGQGGFKVLDVLSNDRLLDMIGGELCRRVGRRSPTWLPALLL